MKRRKYQLLHDDWGARIAPSSLVAETREQRHDEQEYQGLLVVGEQPKPNTPPDKMELHREEPTYIAGGEKPAKGFLVQRKITLYMSGDETAQELPLCDGREGDQCDGIVYPEAIQGLQDRDVGECDGDALDNKDTAPTQHTTLSPSVGKGGTSIDIEKSEDDICGSAKVECGDIGGGREHEEGVDDRDDVGPLGDNLRRVGGDKDDTQRTDDDRSVGGVMLYVNSNVEYATYINSKGGRWSPLRRNGQLRRVVGMGGRTLGRSPTPVVTRIVQPLAIQHDQLYQ